jgi:hypothetical protein
VAAIVFGFFAVMSAFQKHISQQILYIVLFYFILLAIFWLAALYKQNRMFKVTVAKIEEKWSHDD